MEQPNALSLKKIQPHFVWHFSFQGEGGSYLWRCVSLGWLMKSLAHVPYLTLSLAQVFHSSLHCNILFTVNPIETDCSENTTLAITEKVELTPDSVEGTEITHYE